MPASREYLIPRVQSPGQLPAKRLQEIILIQADEAKGKRFVTYGQLYLFIYDLFPRIQHADKIFRAAFHFEGDDVIVRHYDRPDIQVMRSDRGDDKARRIGKHHGSPTAKRITGGTGRRSHDETIRPVSIQKFSVEIRMDLDHRG